MRRFKNDPSACFLVEVSGYSSFFTRNTISIHGCTVSVIWRMAICSPIMQRISDETMWLKTKRATPGEDGCSWSGCFFLSFFLSFLPSAFLCACLSLHPTSGWQGGGSNYHHCHYSSIILHPNGRWQIVECDIGCYREARLPKRPVCVCVHVCVSRWIWEE